jgi:hypothetical protein
MIGPSDRLEIPEIATPNPADRLSQCHHFEDSRRKLSQLSTFCSNIFLAQADTRFSQTHINSHSHDGCKVTTNRFVPYFSPNCRLASRECCYADWLSGIGSSAQPSTSTSNNEASRPKVSNDPVPILPIAERPESQKDDY